jgi:hypothetical protein
MTPDRQNDLTEIGVTLLWALSGRQYGLTPVKARPQAPDRRPTNVAVLTGPVHEIVEVTQDGEIVPVEAWRVEGRRLIRTDGALWATGQNPDLADDAEGAFTVSYLHGREWPAAAALAAGVLVCELAKAYTRDPSCALPERVQSVAREGVSVQFMDPHDLALIGRTGVPQVDLWLQAVNPQKITQSARVWSPDTWKQ